MKASRHPIRIVTLALLLSCAACGSPGSPLTPAGGVIKIHGTPTGNLLIQFNATEAGPDKKIHSASAISDSSGRYTLK